MTGRRYAPPGILALAPMAFGGIFEASAPPALELRDGFAIVRVRGPLMHHPEWGFDSYEGIRGRVAEALEATPRAVILALDSPGGLMSGCLETARELRAMATAAGVPLVAYVDGQATSAAYALACAAERISAPATAIVGSIGVIDSLVDATAQDAMYGLRFQLVTSGARKADGNPHAPISDEAVAAAKARVDALAGIFAEWVAETRPLTVDEVRALEASITHGAEAEGLGLVDDVSSMDELLASLAGGQIAGAAERTKAEGTTMPTEYEEGVSKLRKAAEGDDENAKAARRMLAALEDGDEKAEGDEEAPEEPKDGDEKAEGDEEEKPEAKAAASLAAKLSALSADVRALKARSEKEERKALRASRSDIADEVFEALASTPLEEVRRIVGAIPRSKAPAPAATATVQATRGAGQGDGAAARLAPEAKAELDRRMGLASAKAGVVERGNKLVLGALVPATGKDA